MELSPDRMSAILDLLRDCGVAEFECEEFHVRFVDELSELPMNLPTPRLEEHPVNPMRHVEPSRDDQWHNPNLWNGSVPPSFPKREPRNKKDE